MSSDELKLNERRKGAPRVEFDRPLDVCVMTIDGTWSGDCLLIEMSDTGAQLKVTGRATELTEFFLLLTSWPSRIPSLQESVDQWPADMSVSFHKTNIGIKSLKETRVEAEPVS